MFIVSLKTVKGKFVMLFAIVIALVVAAAILLKQPAAVNEPVSGCQTDFSAENAEEIADIIEDMGLTVDKDSLTVTDVQIPEKFDETYIQYNALQLRSGFDLTAFKGCTAQKYTYTVTDYPGYENSSCIEINILLYNGDVIGGDICSLELDGFMKGLHEENG